MDSQKTLSHAEKQIKSLTWVIRFAIKNALNFWISWSPRWGWCCVGISTQLFARYYWFDQTSCRTIAFDLPTSFAWREIPFIDDVVIGKSNSPLKTAGDGWWLESRCFRG